MSEEPNYKMYVIPYVVKYFENYNNYNVGDVIEYSNNGVDRWVVAEVRKWNSSLVLIPENPIELVIESVYDNIGQKAEQIINSFNNDVEITSNYIAYFGTNNLLNLIPNFLNRQTEKIWFFDYSCFVIEKNKIRRQCGPMPYYENSEFSSQGGGIIYTDTNPNLNYKLGYRPVITLKVKEDIHDEEKKEISSKLQVGDNVKYQTEEYKNWKVLSIDNDLGTVDIISGGIVKNLTLSGKEDWDNYEDIIQREVDEYKNGEQAKKATTVTSKDLKTLKEIDKSILSSYWLLSKNKEIKENHSYEGGRSILFYYYICTVNRNIFDNYNLYTKNIYIFANYEGDEKAINYYKNPEYLNKINSFSYTAGLRPVITLKLDSVEKLSDEETKKIEESTEKQEKVFIKEQESKNKNYKGPSKVDDSTSSTGNNEVKTSDKDNTKKDNITDNNTSNVEKIVYKDKPFYKYGFYILLVICLIETLLLIIPKINKK